jgi:hypothetical protein
MQASYLDLPNLDFAGQVDKETKQATLRSVSQLIADVSLWSVCEVERGSEEEAEEEQEEEEEEEEEEDDDDDDEMAAVDFTVGSKVRQRRDSRRTLARSGMSFQASLYGRWSLRTRRARECGTPRVCWMSAARARLAC